MFGGVGALRLRMARRPRVVVCGVAQHVTQRGNDRQPVFYSISDRLWYLKLLSEHATRYGTRILGYCLMTNHVHLVAVPDRENSLALTMGRTHCEYALGQNKARERSGHLWQNRFCSCPLDERHLWAALRYVELNPVRAGMVKLAWEHRWSSAAAHLGQRDASRTLDLGFWTGAGGAARWQELLTHEEDAGILKKLRHATYAGRPLGSEEFEKQWKRPQAATA